MDNRVPQFIEFMHRLRELATEQGDTAFADALAECILNVTSANPDCPLGKMCLHDYPEICVMPPAQPKAQQEVHGSEPQQTAGPALNREALLAHVHQLLKEDARFAQDRTILAALEDCQLFRQSNPACPIHRLFEAAEKSQTP